MSTRKMLHEILADGQQPESLWLNEAGMLELHFADGGVTLLPGAAVGGRELGKLSEEAWQNATDKLLSIAMLCGWELSEYDDAIAYIRQFPVQTGHAIQIYPE